MRLWQTRFQVLRALDSLPFPREIVLEKQESPAYHIEERHRRSGSAQIVCTLDGEGAFRHGKNIHKLTRGRTFLECVGDPEAAYYYPSHAKAPWIFLWISFAGEQAIRIVKEMNQKYGYIFDLPLDSGFVPHLQLYKTQRDSFQILTPTAGAKVVHDALAAFGETIEEKIGTSTQAKLTHSAQEIISANLDRSLDIALIAERLHVTREHLTRVFHAQTGITPGQFALEERMRVAARMLLDNTLSCKEIAERLGYDSSSSFARAFKNHYSVSPAQYKNKPHGVHPPASARILSGQNSSQNYQFSESMANLLVESRERFNQYNPCGDIPLPDFPYSHGGRE